MTKITDISVLKNVPNIIKALGDILPIIASQNFKNFEFSIIVTPQNLITVFSILKKHLGYQYYLLSCVSGVDLLKKHYRFLVSYELLSLVFNSRLRVKIFVNDYDFIPTACYIYINANWWEREVWDLFGLYFDNHPDLRRILTDYGFEGYPLRKDFPLWGYREARYDNNQKSIVFEPVVLAQEFRYFDYETTW
jgi:NADH/F420H2 dehydrogenase subunit C